MGTLSRTRQPSNYRLTGNEKCGWAGTTWEKGAVVPVDACRRALRGAPSSASFCLETTRTLGSGDRQGRWERTALSTGHRPRAIRSLSLVSYITPTHPSHSLPGSLERKVFSVQFVEKMRLPEVKLISPASQPPRFKLRLRESKPLWGEGRCVWTSRDPGACGQEAGTSF